jgi:hypothetical protein
MLKKKRKKERKNCGGGGKVNCTQAGKCTVLQVY